MNLRRQFVLAITALCAFAFLNAAPSALAQGGHYSESQAPVIGTLFSKAKLKVNGKNVSKQEAGNGVAFKSCSTIQTFDKPATIRLKRGGAIVIKPNSIVQVCDHEGTPIYLSIITGGGEVINLDNRTPQQWVSSIQRLSEWFSGAGVDGAELPGYLASLGFASTFPSIGGGGSGSSGTSSSGTNPTPTYPNP